VWGSFADLDRHLEELGLGPVDGIVADLGLSSVQLNDAERGFAFSKDGPLDMRFDRSHGPTAAELVNTLDEESLADLLYELGEERRSRAIARRLVARRPIRTTGELRRAVVSVMGPKRGRVDPATRTFQALRIAVNRELDALGALLSNAPGRLAPGGRLVVVSYHSLEDREVKLAFRALERGAAETSGHTFRCLTKKPLAPGEEEVRRNPRARSAKLRALERAAA
jgi:16S rRNA (cytosine1402-N4)-methyltransferase